MRLRLKSVLAMLVTTGMLAGMLGFAQMAQAQTAPTPPPFEPDPAARGCLNFFDANGNLKTSGRINDSPIAAFAMGDGPSRPGDNTDTLYWRAAVKVSGTTWTQTWCPPPAQATGTTTALTAAPASPQAPGTTVNLTVGVAPAAAVGSVQFQSDGANLGPAVSVTAGT